MAAEGQSGSESDKMASDIDVLMKQECLIEFQHAENIAPIDIHQRWRNIFGDKAIDISRVRGWVAHFRT